MRGEPKHNYATLRQLEVARLLAAGETNKGVAAELGVTSKTVEHHRSRMNERLHLRSIADLMMWLAVMADGRNQPKMKWGACGCRFQDRNHCLRYKILTTEEPGPWNNNCTCKCHSQKYNPK